MRILPALLATTLLAAAWSSQAQRVIRVPVAPTIHQVKTTTVDLGNVPLNVAFTRALTFVNTGSEATVVSALPVTGSGLTILQDSCTGATVEPAASCSFTAEVKVGAEGAYSSSAQFIHSKQAAPDIYHFVAVGVAGTETLEGSPSSLAFGDVSVNDSSPASTVTVTNTGTASVNIEDVRFAEQASHFTVSADSCLRNLPPGASCTVSVTFSPIAQANVAARLVAVKSDGASILLANATGAGVRGNPVFSTSQLTFSDAVPGQSSPPSALTLTNTGRGKLGIASLGVTGDSAFSLNGSSCAAELAPGASCTMGVLVTPPDATIRTGYVRLQATNSGTPVVSVQLYVAPAQLRSVLSVSPANLSFASTAVGQSADIALTLRSTGNAPVTVSAYSFTGPEASDFALTSPGSCVGALPAGEECIANIRFTPAAAGSRAATLTLTHDSQEPVSPVTLTGSGIAGDLTASPLSLNFGQLTAGTSATRTVVLANSGQAPVTIGAMTFSGTHATQYSASGCAGQMLNPGGLCTVTITHSPTDAGATVATFRVAHNGVSGSRSVTLASDVQPALAAVASLGNFSCSNIFVGESGNCVASLTNTGTAPLSVSSITRDNAAFGAPVSSCGTTLAAGASCSISLTYVGSSAGTASTSVTVATSAGDVDNTATITVLPPTATVTTTVHAATTVGVPNTAVHTVRNTGTRGTLTFSALPAVTGSGLSLSSHTCVAGVAPGATCTITSRCDAAVEGNFSGSVSIASNAGTLSGATTCAVGPAAAPGASLGAFTCSTAYTGEVSTCTATLSNTGTAASSIGALTRSNASFTAPTHNCGTSLPAGASCTVTTTYTSMVSGAATTTVTVPTGAGSRTGSATANILAPTALLTTVGHPETVTGSPVSAVHTVSNTGSRGTLSLSGVPVATGSGFSVASRTCGTTLAAGASCTVTTSCAAAAAGTFNGTLGVTTNAGALSGALACTVGAPAAPVASLGQFSCPTVFLGTATTCVATLTNTGTAPLPTTGARTRTGTEFVLPTHDCGTSLAAGASCTITMTQTFATAGTKTTTVGWTLNGAVQSRDATAVVEAPQATLTGPGSVSTQSGVPVTLTATLTNIGAGPLTVTLPPTVVGTRWTYTSTTCTASLSQGESCSITATCSPTAVGTNTATLSVSTGAGPKSLAVSCQAQGASVTVTNPYPGVSTDVGTGSQSGNWRRVSNMGLGPVTLNSFVPGRDANTTNPLITFVYDPANPAHCAPSKVLQPGQACDIFESFTRVNATGSPLPFNNVMSAISSTAGSLSWTSTFAIHGVGVSNATPVTQIQAGVPSQVSIRVNNGSPLALSSMAFVPSGLMTNVTGCPSTLAANSSCVLTGTVTPAATAGSATFGVTVDGMFPRVINGVANAPQATGRVGSGTFSIQVVQPTATLTAGTHTPTLVGSTSTATHTLTNTGVGPLPVTSTTVTGAGLTVSNSTCGTSVPVDASCTITTTFVPATAGTWTGSLVVATGAGNKTAALPVSAPQADLALTGSFTQSGSQTYARVVAVLNDTSRTRLQSTLQVRLLGSEATASISMVVPPICSNSGTTVTCVRNPDGTFVIDPPLPAANTTRNYVVMVPVTLVAQGEVTAQATATPVAAGETDLSNNSVTFARVNRRGCSSSTAFAGSTDQGLVLPDGRVLCPNISLQDVTKAFTGNVRAEMPRPADFGTPVTYSGVISTEDGIGNNGAVCYMLGGTGAYGPITSLSFPVTRLVHDPNTGRSLYFYTNRVTFEGSGGRCNGQSFTTESHRAAVIDAQGNVSNLGVSVHSLCTVAIDLSGNRIYTSACAYSQPNASGTYPPRVLDLSTNSLTAVPGLWSATEGAVDTKTHRYFQTRVSKTTLTTGVYNPATGAISSYAVDQAVTGTTWVFDGDHRFYTNAGEVIDVSGSVGRVTKLAYTATPSALRMQHYPTPHLELGSGAIFSIPQSMRPVLSGYPQLGD